MTITQANQKLLFRLYDDYDNREAANIADWIMEHLTGWKKIDRVINSKVPLSANNVLLLEKYIQQLNNHVPVQYILNESWFCGLKLYVDENVLIPRPETEELVGWVSSAIINTDASVLDIGTGSGCIAVSLKHQHPAISMLACDISEAAIGVAKKNALMHKADISFLTANILDPEQWKHLPSVNVIVSNPPYIPSREKENMPRNVLMHEPHTALFVPANDPLLFYKTIAAYAKQKLLPSGNIFVETHEELAGETAELFRNEGLKQVEIKKDMQGKERMIRAY
jgi:release factor glutamine methyltransferase